MTILAPVIALRPRLLGSGLVLLGSALGWLNSDDIETFEMCMQFGIRM